MPAMLAANAKAAPDRPFLTDESGTLTRQQAWDLARAMAHGLHRVGVQHGDHVVVMLDNRREFIASWFGLASLGAVEVPANPEYVGARLVHLFNHSRAAVAIVDDQRLSVIDGLADQLLYLKTVIVVGDAKSGKFVSLSFDQIADTQCAGDLPPVSVADPVAIMYTSGSTGPAKGALLPHGQHYINGWQAVSQIGIDENDELFVCLPLHHNMAQGYGIWPAIVSGAHVTVTAKFSRSTFWDEVARARATVIPFVGAMLVLLTKQETGPTGHVPRVAFGVPVPADVHEEFERRFGITLVHAYGSTEATIVAWGANGPERVPGAAGTIIADFDVRLHDDSDRPIADGETGEICIRPREPYSMFLGYYDDPVRTQAAFRNLWFHSGDRGRFDAEGNLWFVGRADDVIRRRGEFISATEVEEAIATHPAVELAVAYAVPSELTDSEVMVAAVLRPGHDTRADELRAWTTSRLAPFAVPRFVEIVEELPMTATGKVEKYKLRARGVSGATSDARATEGMTQ
jgi:carnitine-CoA ligase